VRLIGTPDWSGGTLSENPGNVRYAEDIERYIKSDAVSLLLVSHSYFLASGIDRICSPERSVTHRPAPPILSPRPSTPQSTVANTKQCGGSDKIINPFWLRLAYTGFAVCVLLALYFGWLAHSYSIDLKDTEKNLVKMTEKKEAAERLQKEIQKILEQKAMQLRRTEETLKNRETDIGRLERENRELNDQLDTARRDADAGLKEENAELKQKSQEDRKNVDKMREGLNNMLEHIQNLLRESAGEQQ